jgi:hypothetical protein
MSLAPPPAHGDAEHLVEREKPQLLGIAGRVAGIPQQ